MLENQNEELKERIRWLEGILEERPEFPLAWGITPNEGKLLSFMLKREMITKDQAMIHLYGSGPDIGPDPAVLGVYIFKLRKKLGPLDVSIKTIWGRGWAIPPDSKLRISTLQKQAKEAKT